VTVGFAALIALAGSPSAAVSAIVRSAGRRRRGAGHVAIRSGARKRSRS
jgi:hypothetical protein